MKKQIPVGLVSLHGQWKLALILFVGSIILTLLWWRALPATYSEGENTDYVDYYKPVGESLLDGRGFVVPDGKLASRYPPGYPCLLAGLFGLSKVSGLSEEVVVASFTLLCTALSVLLIYWLASMVWGIGPAAIAAGAWMSYPFLLWLTLEPHSETPFLVVFYASVCLFWLALRRRTRGWPVYFLLGCLLGIAMLIRPIALLLGFVFGLILWLVGTEFPKRQRLFLASMILLGNLATVLPWEAWLYQRTGKVILLSTSGVRAMRDGLTFAVKTKGFRSGLKVPNDVAELMRAVDSRYQELNSISSVASLLVEQLKERPVALVKLFAIKVGRSWYGTDSQHFEGAIKAIQIFYLSLIVGSSILAWKQGGAPRQLLTTVWLIALYFWGMNVISTTLLRYQVPVIGLLFVPLPALCETGWAQRIAASFRTSSRSKQKESEPPGFVA